MEILLIIIPLFIFFLGVFIVLKYSKKKGLAKNKIDFLVKNFKRISAEIDNKHKIINYDKLFHKILTEIGYVGAFGDILKTKPNEIKNLDKIWELHKLRNKLVHDFDIISNVVLNKKAIEYKKEIEKLLKNVS